MFLSDKHKERFKEALTISNKISTNGTIDTEYGVAFFLLTSHPDIWAKCKSYLNTGIDFTVILRRGAFSSGERLIVLLARDLFGARTSGGISIYDMVCTLDDKNFEMCLSAMRLRKRGHLTIEMLRDQSSH